MNSLSSAPSTTNEALLDELRILRTVQMKKRFAELKNVENP